MNKRLKRLWVPRRHDHARTLAFAEHTGLAPAIAAILLSRGLTTVESAEHFLRPSLEALPDPFTMKGMQEATRCLEEALRLKKTVLIYADYDVDGTTGAAVLGHFLAEHGLVVHYHQPCRLKDGYGLQAASIRRLREQLGNSGEARPVLITVDCGISNHAEIALARELGFTVLLTDHHRPSATLPAADAILNPWQPGCEFPCKSLAGVGVAFYLLMGLRTHLTQQGYWEGRPPPNLRRYLDLVALGTIADIVPLVGANRIMVKAGLQELAKSERPGLLALLRVADLSGPRITSEDVAFQLAPRLNAAGRVGSAERALRLLLTQSSTEAMTLARLLDEENQNRKELEANVYQEAFVQAEEIFGRNKQVAVVQGHGWHLGVVGIVAAKLMHAFYRPVVLLSLENGRAKGSARSIPGIDLYECLRECEGLLDKFGGHASAAGVQLKTTQIQLFADKIEEVVSGLIDPGILQPRLDVDWNFDGPAELDEKLLADFFMLEPFGKDNERPVFTGDVREFLLAPRRVGAGRDHLRFQLRVGQGKLDGVGFNLGHLNERLAAEGAAIAFSFKVNAFRGKERAEVLASDLLFESDK